MTSSRTGLRCLVADDEPQIGSLLTEVLTREGYEVDAVQNGDAASKKLAQGEYDLALFDVLMPFKSGVELILQLRDAGNLLPVVLMSSHLTEEVITAVGLCRHLAFLQKPFSLDELRKAVRLALEASNSDETPTPLPPTHRGV